MSKASGYAAQLRILSKRYPSVKVLLREIAWELELREGDKTGLFYLAPKAVIGAFVREDRGIIWVFDLKQKDSQLSVYKNTGWSYVECPEGVGRDQG